MKSHVRLIARTVPALPGMRTAAELVTFTARVSNPSNQENFDTAGELLAYCLRKHHVSIFEMAHLVLEIKTSRAIGRQLLRHRSFSYQEFSQRYAKVTSAPYLMEARLQDPVNRQNSVASDDVALEASWDALQMHVWDTATQAYEEALEQGLAKEVARAVLPEGMAPSTMYMAGTLRSWITYCAVRAFGEGVQKEHRDIALQAWDILCEEFPFLIEMQWAVEQMGSELRQRG